MKILLLACADHSILDANTNRVSMINVMDEIRSPQFPLIIPNISIMAISEREAADLETAIVTVRFKMGDAVLMETPLAMSYAGGATRNRAIVAVNGLVVAAPGDLIAEIQEGDEVKGTWRIPVKHLDPPVLVNGQPG